MKRKQWPLVLGLTLICGCELDDGTSLSSGRVTTNPENNASGSVPVTDVVNYTPVSQAVLSQGQEIFSIPGGTTLITVSSTNPSLGLDLYSQRVEGGVYKGQIGKAAHLFDQVYPGKQPVTDDTYGPQRFYRSVLLSLSSGSYNVQPSTTTSDSWSTSIQPYVDSNATDDISVYALGGFGSGFYYNRVVGPFRTTKSSLDLIVKYGSTFEILNSTGSVQTAHSVNTDTSIPVTVNLSPGVFFASINDCDGPSYWFQAK